MEQLIPLRYQPLALLAPGLVLPQHVAVALQQEHLFEVLVSPKYLVGQLQRLHEESLSFNVLASMSPYIAAIHPIETKYSVQLLEFGGVLLLVELHG